MSKKKTERQKKIKAGGSGRELNLERLWKNGKIKTEKIIIK